MKLITLDFETYYADDFSLSKMTTEEYIRDPRFEPIMMGYKLDDDKKQYSVVGRTNIQMLLDALNVENSMVLCHHAHFDGLILSHHFGHKPKIWLDTLSMARAIHGTEVGGSLGKLLAHYGVGIEKGTFVVNAKNKRLADFTPDELAAYRRYCCDDVEGTYRIFYKMLEGFPRNELKHIDMLIRMFTEPVLGLDEDLLRQYAMDIQAEKMTALFSAGVTRDEVMSNEKFATALRNLGVSPPMKISPATQQPAYAFAKTDQGLTDLLEDPDVRVQALVSARLGVKTTIEETRALRLASMSTRGPACVYYKYAGAEQTMRVSGGDKTNFQNLKRGGTLRESIYAPED